MKLKPRLSLAALALSSALLAAPVISAEKSGISKPPSPNIHVLIMAIGAYKNGVTPLNGVQFDVETATQIAKKMGAMENNIRVYRDDQLTLVGMKKAFDELDSRVQPDDQVFIYYSGHGGRQKMNDPALGERCAAAFITVDGDGFMDVEVKERLKQLSGKAQKLIVMIDACHSGGIATRSLNDANTEFTPKFWFKGGAGDTCARPVNIVTRSISADLKTPGSGANNYTYIAAARENEISLDQPGKGGVASQAWLQCMNGDAQDLDGSGSISAEEIRICAQEKIEIKLAKAKSVRPHHVTITGNSDLTIGFTEKAASAPAPAPAQSSTPPATTASKPAPGKTNATSAKPNPLATLTSIYGNRDDKRVVEFKAAKPKLTIDKDIFDFTLKSSHDGYVYLLMVGSDGHSFDLLFPNQLDHKNEIRAGETLKLPRATWELGVQGPPGKDTLLAIVAESPRNFSQIGMQPSGPFSSIDAQTSPGSGRDMQMASTSSANANSEECLMPKTRNLTIRKRCSPAYGAALVTIEEIK
jgi:hypothetical protein